MTLIRLKAENWKVKTSKNQQDRYEDCEFYTDIGVEFPQTIENRHNTNYFSEMRP